MTRPTILGAVRAEREGDNSLLTPIDALRTAIDDIESGECPADGVLVLRLSRGAEGMFFDTGWYASNMKSSEMLALVEVFRHRILAEMCFGQV